jgi:hypothetical protein
VINIQIAEENTRVKKICIWLAYIFCISLVAFYSIKKPEYNWDMLGYMALVLRMENKNIDEIHRMTYENARENIPAESYQRLTDSSNAYRKKMKEHATEFYQQLPFYIVKPLYIVSVYLFYKAGVSLPRSTVLPSVLSYFVIGIFLLFWLQQIVSLFYASCIGLLLMISPPFLMVAKLSTPDGLSALLIFSAFYFLIGKPSFKAMSIFLLLSMLARLDNILLASALLFLLMLIDNSNGKLSVSKYTPVILSMAGCFFCITATVRSFGWSLFYYPSFMGYLHLAAGLKTGFLFPDYLHLLYSAAINGFYHAYFPFFLLAGIFFAYKKRIGSLKNPNQDLLVYFCLLLVSLLRFLLQPDLSDRFFIAYYLIGAILFTRKIAEDSKNWPEGKFAQ